VADKARLGWRNAVRPPLGGNHEDYIKYLNEGNRLRKEEIKYSFEESQSFHSIIKPGFSSTQPIVQSSSKNTSDRPKRG
ncbi:hypothetical protein, partial [Candidatus Pseudothioglobus singularis]|uniref:hypothetical protein n=1 Tax=Candidatus Pseudothioglobus singularis TaxID=1427364 RepID=UPI001BFFD7D6